jgi:hypothetical protein
MSTSDSKPTEKQSQVLTYLKDHRINDELNIIVNRLCHAQTEDPFAFMVRRAEDARSARTACFGC